MINKVRSRVVALSCALLCLTLLPSEALAADGGEDDAAAVSGSAEGTGDGGGQVTISVESSVTTAGSGGGDGSGGGVTSSSSSGTEVTVAPVCYYKPGDTGAQTAQGINDTKKELAESSKRASGVTGPLVRGVNDIVSQQMDKNFPDYESHKDDAQGRWYGRYCDASRLDPKNNPTFKEDLEKERKAFYEANPDQNIWVPAGQQAPRPYISGTRLAKVAWEAVKIPAPTVETNPKVGDRGATLVGMDTWVWATGNTPTSVTATATAGSTTATITAGSSGLQLSAPDGKASCTGFGVAWHPGMPEGSSPCTISFNRSSAHLGGSTPLTIKVAYSASYTATDGNSGTLPAITTTSTINLPVAEVQTLTTNASNPRQN